MKTNSIYFENPRLQKLLAEMPFPQDDHFLSIQVVCLCNIGQVEKAMEYIQTYPASVAVWNSILATAPLKYLCHVITFLPTSPLSLRI